MESKKSSRKKRNSVQNADLNANSFIMKFLQAHGLEIVRTLKQKENSELFLGLLTLLSFILKMI